jgi:hypothetical protein
MEHTATSPSGVKPRTGVGRPVEIAGETTTICRLEINDETVARYLSAFPVERRGEEIMRAISLGVHGLVATGMRATVDEMKDEVRQILETAAAAAEARVGQAVEAGRTELAAHLDPEVRSSLTARTVNELQQLHSTTLARLDPDRSDSHTARLVAAVTDLLGPNGLLAQRLESVFDSAEADQGLGRLLDLFERRFQEMRDLVVGEQHRQAESARGTAKGLEFEDEVEALLRSQALAINGCIVERTGRLGGTLGAHSKVGDFVVTLPDGTAIAVEAKNTSRIALAGSTGILRELDQAMDNRKASWAICVSRSDAYPGEVGSFAVYGNRILLVDSGEGTLTGVALRWIAASARASVGERGVTDTAAAFDGLGRIRDLAQHFSRSKKILNTAQSGLESVREDLDSLRGQLLDLVDDIARSLHPAPPLGKKVA